MMLRGDVPVINRAGLLWWPDHSGQEKFWEPIQNLLVAH